MNTDTLRKFGLTESQAKTYLALIKHGQLTPPQLSKETGESRTAAYMALAKLEEIGLAKQLKDTKKQKYAPTNPSSLEKILAKRREEVAQAEDLYHESLPNLLSYYFTHRPEPGVRFFQGEDGLKKIYEDHLRTKAYVSVLRTAADDGYFGEVLYRYLDKRAELNIKSELMGPALPGAVQWAGENDTRLKRTVTWIPPKNYTAPVEISIYGQKVSYISFGEEAVGMIIDSPQIAEAMRQLFAIAKVGADELMKKDK